MQEKHLKFEAIARDNIFLKREYIAQISAYPFAIRQKINKKS